MSCIQNTAAAVKINIMYSTYNKIIMEVQGTIYLGCYQHNILKLHTHSTYYIYYILYYILYIYYYIQIHSKGSRLHCHGSSISSAFTPYTANTASQSSIYIILSLTVVSPLHSINSCLQMVVTGSTRSHHAALLGRG
jgi:hypothetical protein